MQICIETSPRWQERMSQIGTAPEKSTIVLWSNSDTVFPSRNGLRSTLTSWNVSKTCHLPGTRRRRSSNGWGLVLSPRKSSTIWTGSPKNRQMSASTCTRRYGKRFSFSSILFFFLPPPQREFEPRVIFVFTNLSVSFVSLRFFFCFSVLWIPQHDTLIASLLNLYDVFDGKAPRYCATVLVELWQNIMYSNYSVKVLHLDCDDMKPRVMLQLPLAEFADRIRDKLPANWDKECGRQDSFIVNRLDGQYRVGGHGDGDRRALLNNAFATYRIINSLLHDTNYRRDLATHV